MYFMEESILPSHQASGCKTTDTQCWPQRGGHGGRLIWLLYRKRKHRRLIGSTEYYCDQIFMEQTGKAINAACTTTKPLLRVEPPPHPLLSWLLWRGPAKVTCWCRGREYSAFPGGLQANIYFPDLYGVTLPITEEPNSIPFASPTFTAAHAGVGRGGAGVLHDVCSDSEMRSRAAVQELIEHLLEACKLPLSHVVLQPAAPA